MRRARAYTVMEVMFGLAVLAIGTMGIVAMQKVTAATNRDARNLVIATQLARTWIDRLKTDAVTWNHPSSASDAATDLAGTTWLNKVNGQWFRPADTALEAAGADAFGNDVASTATGAVFCTNLRLNWMPNNPTSGPPLTIKADVRVFWIRTGGGGPPTGTTFCDANADAVTAATANYHFVFMTSAITQNLP
jgi:Tfp pilus assembly protein PilV